MDFRVGLPIAGPVFWSPKSAGERAIEAAARPQQSPERAAESRHESRHASRWVVFGCVAGPSLYFMGPVAFWWLVPFALVLVLAQAAAATATPAELAYQQATREIRARGPKMGPNGCTWCGSVAMHRDTDGRVVWPHTFHAAVIDAAISSRAADLLRASR